MSETRARFTLELKPSKIESVITELAVAFPHAWIAELASQTQDLLLRRGAADRRRAVMREVAAYLSSENESDAVAIAAFQMLCVHLSDQGSISKFSQEDVPSESIPQEHRRPGIARPALERFLLEQETAAGQSVAVANGRVSRRLNTLYRNGFITGTFTKPYTQVLSDSFISACTEASTFTDFLEVVAKHRGLPDAETTRKQLNDFGETSFTFWKKALSVFLSRYPGTGL